MASGLYASSCKDYVKNLRDDFFKGGTQTRVDDYLQYSPAMLLIGLKACGYQGRSAWGRMLVADAFSVAVMAALVNGIKYPAKVMRPDNSRRNSFPSGHTATAFMAATMLHKEYGQTRSPWFSVAGYSLATATGVMRIINNRHWISDVLMGAGIGIFSTELAYWFADLIFKDKYLKRELLPEPSFDPLSKPSFFGLSMGARFVPGRCPTGNAYPSAQHMRFTPGAFAGIEGAWFTHPHWGLGGQVLISDFAMAQDRVAMHEVLAAAHFSANLHERIAIGAKAGCGYGYVSDEFNHAVEAVAGVSLTFKPYRRLGLKLFADYIFSSFVNPVSNGLPSAPQAAPCPYLHSLVAGAGAQFYIGL